MSDKPKKKKCPNCKKNTLIIEYEDCILCGGGQYYHCLDCDSYYEYKIKGGIGDEL